MVNQDIHQKEKLMTKKKNVVRCLSSYANDQCQRQFWCPEKKIRVIMTQKEPQRRQVAKYPSVNHVLSLWPVVQECQAAARKLIACQTIMRRKKRERFVVINTHGYPDMRLSSQVGSAKFAFWGGDRMNGEADPGTLNGLALAVRGSIMWL